ncbi:MAG: hypothetical protein U0R68_14760 [Candidatus Nanopelagicales bacterium]
MSQQSEGEAEVDVPWWRRPRRSRRRPASWNRWMLSLALITVCLVGLSVRNLVRASAMSWQDWCGVLITVIAIASWGWYLSRPSEDTSSDT